MERFTVGVDGVVAGAVAAAVAASPGGAAPTAGDAIGRGRLTFLEWRVEPGAADAVRQAIACGLGHWIVEVRQAEALLALIGQRYACFGRQERGRILALAQARLVAGLDGPNGRLARICRSLADYLERQPTVVLEGFITFRLKDYVDELRVVVELAVEDLLLEREYHAFLALLRSVVERRADRPPRVHCLPGPDGTFVLEDDGGVGLALDAAEARDVGAEEVLISALVTLAPLRVELHLPRGGALSDEAFSTLEAVFTGAVGVCRGCGRCSHRARG